MRTVTWALALAVTVGMSGACTPAPSIDATEQPAQAPSTKLLTQLQAIPTDDDFNDVPDYERSEVFGSWQSTGNSCDLRADILRTSSSTPVTTNENCTVTSGTWDDPYTPGRQQITDPLDIDIDHVRPAANAYQHGLWRLPQDSPILDRFYNYRPNLLPVSSSENRSKGDDGPSEYLPDDPSVHCDYSRIWVEVSVEFDLTVTTADKQALTNLLRAC